MSLRYYKRIGGNKGLGFNVSSSGISSSYSTKYGTVSSRGFSIRTGIPGLTFRQSFRGKNKGAEALIVLAVIFSILLLYYSAIIAYNLILFLIWFGDESRKYILRKYYLWKEEKEIRQKSLSSSNEKFIE